MSFFPRDELEEVRRMVRPPAREDAPAQPPGPPARPYELTIGILDTIRDELEALHKIAAAGPRWRLTCVDHDVLTVGVKPVPLEPPFNISILQVLVIPEEQPVRWAAAGREPTGDLGVPLAKGDGLKWDADPTGLKFVRDSAAVADTPLHVLFFAPAGIRPF